MTDTNTSLTFTELRRVNLARCLRWHPGGIDEWSMAEWFTALAGEVGELGGAIKEFLRYRDGVSGKGWDLDAIRTAIRHEIADVAIYLDLLAARDCADLGTIIAEKFNRTSEKLGFPERLSIPAAPQVAGKELEALSGIVRRLGIAIAENDNNDTWADVADTGDVVTVGEMRVVCDAVNAMLFTVATHKAALDSAREAERGARERAETAERERDEAQAAVRTWQAVHGAPTPAAPCGTDIEEPGRHNMQLDWIAWFSALGEDSPEMHRADQPSFKAGYRIGWRTRALAETKAEGPMTILAYHSQWDSGRRLDWTLPDAMRFAGENATITALVAHPDAPDVGSAG